MTKTFDQLIDHADSNLNDANEHDTDDGCKTFALLTISYTLIAIAQELHRMNDSRELEEARVERLSDPISGKTETMVDTPVDDLGY